MEERYITCKRVGCYEDALTRGKKYKVVDENVSNENVKIIGDNGRTRWYSSNMFDLDGNIVPVLVDWRYDDQVDQDDNGEDWNWIEISFTLSDGANRWSILYTPERLLSNLKRDNIDPPGLHIPHLIIVRSYRKEDISRVLKYLDDEDELIEASLPLNSHDDLLDEI